MKLRLLFFGLGLTVLIPYLSWRVAVAFDPEALLVGPYLLASPLLALHVGVTAMYFFGPPVFRGEHRRDAKPSPALTKRARQLGVEVGLGQVDVLIMTSQSDNPRSAPFMSDGIIYVYNMLWSQLSHSAQDFALARALAKDTKSRRAAHVVTWTLLFSTGIGAALNLWLILLIHATGVTGLLFHSWRYAERLYIGEDKRALALTKDLQGALEFLDRAYTDSEKVAFNVQVREEELRKAAAQMGI
jgi:hypothetical protein